MQQASASLRTNSTVQVGEQLLRIQQRLGNGAFGVVYKVKDVASSRVYALKDVLCSDRSEIRNAISEAITLNEISHKNVIAVKGADQFRDSQGLHMLILTDYYAGGNLNERLNQPSSDSLNYKWMSQIADALAYLHSSEVVHRDLKPENVLLTKTAENIKLADFGLAREFIALKTDARLDDDSWLNSYAEYYMNSEVGTAYWIAPEVFYGHYTEKADVFSLGVLFFAILERDFIEINGKKFFGAFECIRGSDKVGLGYAMAMHNRDIRIAFSLRAQGSNVQQRLALEALQYEKNDRPSAAEIHARIANVQQNVKLHDSGNQQQPSSAEGGSAAGGCC